MVIFGWIWQRKPIVDPSADADKAVIIEKKRQANRASARLNGIVIDMERINAGVDDAVDAMKKEFRK